MGAILTLVRPEQARYMQNSGPNSMSPGGRPLSGSPPTGVGGSPTLTMGALPLTPPLMPRGACACALEFGVLVLCDWRMRRQAYSEKHLALGLCASSPSSPAPDPLQSSPAPSRPQAHPVLRSTFSRCDLRLLGFCNSVWAEYRQRPDDGEFLRDCWGQKEYVVVALEPWLMWVNDESRNPHSTRLCTRVHQMPF